MKTIKKVEANVDRLIDGNWMWFDPNPDDEIEITRITPENIREAAIHYNVPEKFIEMLDDALRAMANDIVAELHKDLEDLWNRL